MKFSGMNLKRYMAIVFALLLIALPLWAAETTPSTTNAAVVNDVIISQEEYTKELDFHIQRASQQGVQLSDEQMVKLKEEILDSLIERELLYQESQKAGINVDDKSIDDQLAVIKKRFASEEEFKNMLVMMKNSEEDVKAQIKKGLAIKELIETRITPKIVITDEESKNFYGAHPELFKQPEQVKASHILIKVETGANEQEKAQAKKKIEEVQAKLKGGQDFTELAKEYSEGPSSANGGDLGYFRRGQMVKPFEDAAFEMQPNDVSDIVETQFGYHLIKVYDRSPEKVLTYAEVKDRLIEQMKQQKTEQEALKYIEQLKKEAKIEKSL
jgi:peptidyl-prolyl cis-trans isomerase C